MRNFKYITLLGTGIFFIISMKFLASCGGDKKDKTTETPPIGGSSSCTLTDNTTETTTKNEYGCALLSRDVSSCSALRIGQGFTGFWLKFSCRISLSRTGPNVTIISDSQPDSKSNYFGAGNICQEDFSAADRTTTTNLITSQNIKMTVPFTGTKALANSAFAGTVSGIARSGASIFANTGDAGTDIYEDLKSVDKCGGHPDSIGRYHYHTEPPSITNADSTFIGVMRDGIPIYGRLDDDGSTPVLDSTGGHVGITADSNRASVYHYHLNEQSNGTESRYFLTTGTYAGTPGICTGCD